VINEQRDVAAFSKAAAVVLEIDANGSQAWRQRLRAGYFRVNLPDVVVLIDGLPLLDVKGIPARHSAFGYKHSVSAALWHFNRGDDGVRRVFGVGGRALGDRNCARVIRESGPPSDKAGTKAGVQTFPEAVVQRENVVFFRLDPEVILQFLQLIRI